MKLLLDKLSELELKFRGSGAKKGTKRSALMTHVVLGYPSLKESIDIVAAMAQSGASVIELQIPFSDPMADGPTIMKANEEALLQGVTPADCMKAMEKLSRRVNIPLLFMSYYNLLFAYTRNPNTALKHFCKDASNAGAQGLIVPDIPPEEKGDGYFDCARENKLIPIPLVSPLSSSSRLKTIAKNAPDGFVYCVSTTGTTGARDKLPKGTARYLKNVRRHFSIPLAVGFGISTPQQISTLSSHAEIAVVGSKMIDVIEKSPRNSIAKNVRRFTKLLAQA